MAAANPNPFPLTNKRITDNIIQYAKKAQDYTRSQFDIRGNLESIDRAYMREDDMTEEDQKARIANTTGDKKKRRNITVPVVMPQVESALTYLSEVFLTGYPIFGVGSPVEYDDAALQLETIIAEQSVYSGWARQFLMFFRDGLKYNLQAIEVVWDQIATAAIETTATVGNTKMGKPKEVIWSGNCLKRMNLYNTVFDPRVAPAEIHTKGEFAGYTELYSRIQLKRLINNLLTQIPVSVQTAAMQAGTTDYGISSDASTGYYMPAINPSALIDKGNVGSFDWMAWATDAAKNKIQYKNIYSVFKLYARIIPEDFGLFVPQDGTPQVWKFIIINDQVLLYAERCTNAHDFIPIIFGQPIEDGLDYQTKSFAQNVAPFQDLASAAINASIASKRKLVMDRMFYDPTKIREADINSDNPSAKIPVRPTAYGKPVTDAFAVVPYRDELSASVTQEAELYVRYSNLTNGQNPAQQGQFVKGNKTLREYEDVMGHGNSRNRMMALGSEYQVLQPIKEIIKINILQYQEEDTIYNRDRKVTVKIDPLTLRKAVAAFKVSDGFLPSEKLLNTEEFQVAAQVLGSSPELSSRYRIDQVFSHLFKQRGVDLRPFEKTPVEIQYEQALAAWQQAAALAAQKGTPFSTPMPTPPDPKQLEEQRRQQLARSGVPLAELVEAAAQQTQNGGY